MIIRHLLTKLNFNYGFKPHVHSGSACYPAKKLGAPLPVVIATNTNDLNPLLDQAVRLLRLGGVIVLLDAFGGGKVGDPAQRDTATVSRRLLVQRIGNDPRLTPSLLPVGDGLLIAVVNRYDFPADL